ncbi:MAG: GNAT family N-acetyltransferase [Chloroflexota bacterium]
MIGQFFFAEPWEQKEASVEWGEYRIEVVRISEPGPTVEVSNLFHRLYAQSQHGEETSPYFAGYLRFRAKAFPRSGGRQDNDSIAGSAEYRYWPSLNLGYIEYVQVDAGTRRKGLGVKLVNFIVDYMRRKGSWRVYAFAVNAMGCRLLARAGFTDETPEDPASPRRKWFFCNTRRRPVT